MGPERRTSRSSALTGGPLYGLDAGRGAQGGGDMRQVPRVGDLDVEVHVEEVGMAAAHVDGDDIAAGLADDGAGLPQHARRVTDGGVQAALRDGVALGFGRPLQVPPAVLLVLEGGQLSAVD